MNNPQSLTRKTVRTTIAGSILFAVLALAIGLFFWQDAD